MVSALATSQRNARKLPIPTRPPLPSHRLRIEPALEDQLRGDLVDDGAAALHIATNLVQRPLRGHGGESLIPQLHFAGDARAELFGKGARLLRSRCLLYTSDAADER